MRGTHIADILAKLHEQCLRALYINLSASHCCHRNNERNVLYAAIISTFLKFAEMSKSSFKENNSYIFSASSLLIIEVYQKTEYL